MYYEVHSCVIARLNNGKTYYLSGTDKKGKAFLWATQQDGAIKFDSPGTARVYINGTFGKDKENVFVVQLDDVD